MPSSTVQARPDAPPMLGPEIRESLTDLGAEQRLPAGPLIDRLIIRYGSLLALGPAARRRVHRYQHTGLTADQADRAAVHLLGLHPASVWGWDWYRLD
ncbi:MAG: hypothetical protein ACR2MN_13955 [Acidimicrobiales bacterium]